MTTATTSSPFARLWNRIRSIFGKPAAQPAPWFDGAGSAFADLHAEPPPRRQPVPATPVVAMPMPKPAAATVSPARLPVTTATSAGVAAAAAAAAAHKAAYNASVKAHDANAVAVEAALRQAFAAADRPAGLPAARAPAASSPAAAAAAVRAAPGAQAAPAAPAKALRSLEEVRADLARLRETTRARHAKAFEERDTNFAPTDFMDYDATRVEPRAPQFAAYAPTEFMDFSSMKLPPLKSDRSDSKR